MSQLHQRITLVTVPHLVLLQGAGEADVEPVVEAVPALVAADADVQSGGQVVDLVR